jgi:Transcription factor AFT
MAWRAREAPFSTTTQPHHHPRLWRICSAKFMGHKPRRRCRICSFPTLHPQPQCRQSHYRHAWCGFFVMALLFPSMPAHLRPALNRAIAAIPEPWLPTPKSGEVFESKEFCKKRLQAFAFTQGFAIVIGKSDKNRAIFHCIHYNAETRNNRGLKPRMIKEKEGRIISQRQRNTYYQKKNCL